MKYIYFLKYLLQNVSVGVLIIFGFYPSLNEAFDEHTVKHFTKVGDQHRAFKYYLLKNKITEKPYFLKNGFELKIEFKMSVLELTEEELKLEYPIDIIRKNNINC